MSALEEDFGNAIDDVQNIDTIVSQDLVPLLYDESISTSGTMRKEDHNVIFPNMNLNNYYFVPCCRNATKCCTRNRK